MVSPRDQPPAPRDAAAAPPGPPESEAWSRQLAILWSGQCASIGGATFVFPYLPTMVGTVGVTGGAAVALWSGALIAVTQVTLAATAPLWGRIADRYGRKPMLVRAQAGAGVVLILTGLSPNIWLLFAARALQGAAAGTISANTALVASTAPRERVAQSIGIIQSGSYIGTTVGPGLGAVLVPVVGIRPAFAIAGIFPLLAAVGTAIGVREHFVRPDRSRPVVRAREAIRAAGMGRSVVTLVVLAGLAQTIGSSLAPAIPLRALDLVGPEHNAAAVGAVFALQAGAAAVVAVNAARLAAWLSYRTLLIVATAWAGLWYGLLGAAPSLPLFIVAAGIGGLGAGALLPSINTLIGRVSPHEVRAEVFGWSASVMAVGGAVAPIASTVLVATFSTAAPFFMIAGIEVVMLVWSAARVRRRVSRAG